MSETLLDRKTFFIDNLSNLVTSEYEEMFRILKKGGGDWSENCNGIFFDIMKLSDDLFDKLYTFLEYCLKQRVNDADRIMSMNEMKKDIKTDEPKEEPHINDKDFVITL